MEREKLNLDKVFCDDKHYPFVIETLLTVLKYPVSLKNKNVSIDNIDKQKFDEYLDLNYPDEQYESEDLWFEDNGTAIYVITDREKNKIRAIFISHDDLDIIYRIPSLFWELFDKSKDIRLLTKSIRYSVKKLYDPSPIERLDESDKIKYDLVELVYKKLSGSFETRLEFEMEFDKFGFFHIIPVFYFDTILSEDYLSDKLLRTTSIVGFFDVYYQMEDTIRTINRLMEERNGK